MNTILILIMIISLYFKNIWIGSLACFAFFTSLGIHHGLPGCYRETMEDYPKEDCVKPQIWKRLFPYNRSEKGLPKEIYVVGVGIYMGFWIYLVVLSFACMVGETVARWIMIIYFFYFAGLVNIYCTKLYVKAFKARYKVFNKYNIRYFCISEDEPYPQKIGKCEIIEEYGKRRKQYAKVRVLGSNEIISDVLITASAKSGKRSQYPLFEICNVKYIS